MKLICIVLISLSFRNYGFSQNILQIFKSNVGLLKSYYKDSVEIGTGTMIFKPLDGRSDYGYIFIVTNKHVLPDFSKSKYIEFDVANPDSSKTLFSKFKIQIYKDDGKYDEHVMVSEDEDLAIIEFGDQYSASELYIKKHQLFGIEYLATKKTLKENGIGIGDMVFFQGYPSFFYEEDNLSPVFRTGFIATNPSQSYHFNKFLRTYVSRNILNGFLIDGNVFGGSSGSLVCLYPTLLNQTSQLHPELNTQKGLPWILGILTESYYDIGTKDPNTQRLNIGGVISSEKISELINSYKHRNK